MIAQANKHRREPEFDIENKVYLSTNYLRLKLPSTKAL